MATPSWTTRLSLRSSGSASPRFSFHSRMQRGFVRAHDDPCVRAAKEMAAGTVTSCGRMWIHDFLRNELYAYVCSADREPSRQRVVVW